MGTGEKTAVGGVWKVRETLVIPGPVGRIDLDMTLTVFEQTEQVAACGPVNVDANGSEVSQ